tara:strand:+ start:459 stop:1082 length:624 start_codon:yes stop_codon:yes gene_type:complete
MTRFILFTLLLCFCLLLSCTTTESDSVSKSEKAATETTKDTLSTVAPLFSDIEFRIEDYDEDTLSNYEVSDEFFNEYIKGTAPFRVNNNNPLVNAATIKYYILDTVIHSDIKMLTILETASTKIVGARIIALFLNSDNTTVFTKLVAMTEENDYWKETWRSYVENDTLHLISTEINNKGEMKIDTSQSLFLPNDYRNIHPAEVVIAK